MPKKIYDIKPPKLARKVEKEKKEVVEIKKIKRTKPAAIKKEPEVIIHQEERRPIWIPISAGVLGVLVFLGAFLFFKLPKAEIVIWPTVDVLSFQQAITADKSVDSVSLENAVIPAQYFEAIKTNSQDFLATGNASDEGKATGSITVYNKIDPVTPLTLKAGTRFLSNSGKLFVALEKVVIPAAKKSGSKITPGTVIIKVEAAEGGESYNIAPSSFSIPGLKGTSYYYSITATSDSEMTGGYSGKVKKVTSDDIQSAKDVLSENTLADVTADLKNQISSEYVLLDDAISSSITAASTQIKSGTVAENFNYTATAKASALAFKKSDLDKFIKDYLISKTPEGETLVSGDPIIDYSVSKVDISGGKITLSLNFSSGVYQNIDKNSITLSLIGKNADQITEVVNSSLGDDVSKTEINFWPFWVKSAPNNQKAVRVELGF